MTIAQKMLDERKVGFLEGKEEGREETLRANIIALKELLDPAIIAKQFKVPLEQVMDILNQA